MRKFVLPGILCFLFICPLNLESRQIFIKLAAGISLREDVHDSWHPTTSYYDYGATKGEKTYPPSFNFFLELGYQLNPNISFSLGAGSFSNGLCGSTGQFKHPATSDFSGDFSYSPEFNLVVYPLYLTVTYSYPVFLSARLNVLGGVGYYFGKVNCISENQESEAPGPLFEWSYFHWKYRGTTNTIGYHAGVGFEIDLSMKTFFFAEALYRSVGFNKFEITSSNVSPSSPIAKEIGTGEGLGGSSTFFYAQRKSGDEVLGDIDYRISEFDCSGFVFRSGIKFRF